jgi:hypothetical protein
MIQPMRSVMTGMLMLSLFSLASCNRSWCDCFLSRCEVKSCAPSGDSCPQPRGTSCDTGCKPARSALKCPKPCAEESNPFFPCDPSAAPCGNGRCDESYPEEKCYGKMNVYKTCDDCVVEICQRAPEFATVGSPYPVELMITARKECADVMVSQTLPCDSEFVKSDPPATPDKNNSLQWSFPHMTCGETQKICVWIKPMKEGCCLAAATVCACPQLCAYTRCGQPVVCIKKWGPETACLYCPISYCVEVCNSGSATAYDVVVEDVVPEGLTHESGRKCLTYQLGNLCPGDKKRFTIDFCAAKRGCVTNTATVSFCGGPKCSAEATTLINEPCVQVSKTGPDSAFICKVVDYNITITNPGDLILRDVVVDDVSPIGTTIVAAPGAEICCNRAIWCIPQLCPGETKTFTVSVRSQVAGCLTNKVTVTTNSDCGQCTSCAEATTCWKGIAATHMCMVDTVDPICIGDTSVYRICITNRGTADDSNVKLVIKFSDQLKPQSFNGPTNGRIVGNSVEFDVLETLGVKQSVEYSITVKAVSSGDGRGEARLSSDSLTTPVVDVESTHVY